MQKLKNEINMGANVDYGHLTSPSTVIVIIIIKSLPRHTIYIILFLHLLNLRHFNDLSLCFCPFLSAMHVAGECFWPNHFDCCSFAKC